MYTALLIVAAILPLAMSAFFTWRWWRSLTHPWLFLTIAVIGLYSLLGFLAKFALQPVLVISPSQLGPEPLLDPPEMRLIVFILGFVFLCPLGLWCVKALLAKLGTAGATQTRRPDQKTTAHLFFSWLWVVITLGLASFAIFFSYGGPLDVLVLMAGVVALFSAIITVLAVFDNRRGSGVALILGAVPIGLSAIPATYIFREFFPLPILLLVGFAVSSGVVGIRAWRHGPGDVVNRHSRQD